MSHVEAYAEASMVLNRYRLRGDILSKVIDALVHDRGLELVTDCRLRIRVENGCVGAAPVDPRPYETFRTPQLEMQS